MVPEAPKTWNTTVAVAIIGISCREFRDKGTGLLGVGP